MLLYITSHCDALNSITFHYTYHHMKLQYITLQHYITLHHINTLHYITLHHINTLHYITLYCMAITLHYTAMHYVILHFIYHEHQH